MRSPSGPLYVEVKSFYCQTHPFHMYFRYLDEEVAHSQAPRALSGLLLPPTEIGGAPALSAASKDKQEIDRLTNHHHIP